MSSSRFLTLHLLAQDVEKVLTQVMLVAVCCCIGRLICQLADHCATLINMPASVLHSRIAAVFSPHPHFKFLSACSYFGGDEFVKAELFA